MAIADNGTRDEYVSTGQTIFNYTFEIFAETDLKVYVNDTLQTLTTDYTVTGVGNGSGGTIVFAAATTSGDVIVIQREVANERTADYQQQGDFLAETVNSDFDRIWAKLQELKAADNRRIGLSDSAVYSGSLSLPAPEASKVLVWNDTEDAIVNGPETTDIAAIASSLANVNAVANSIADVNATGNSITNVNTVAGSISNVNTTAASIAGINSVSGDIANVNAVAAEIADINTVADNLLDVSNFADVYIGASASDPATRSDSSALQVGDLYFSTATNSMKIYDGAAWDDAFVPSALYEPIDAAILRADTSDNLEKGFGVVKGTLSISGGSVALDLSAASAFNLSVTSNFTLSNPTEPTGATGGTWYLDATADSSGPYTIALDSEYTLQSGTLSIPASATVRIWVIARSGSEFDIVIQELS